VKGLEIRIRILARSVTCYSCPMNGHEWYCKFLVCSVACCVLSCSGSDVEAPGLTQPLLTGPARASGAEPLPAGADLSAALSVLFVPDDPTLTLELQLIDNVIAARKRDSATYAEGKNPYRIRYAVYNLSHRSIAAKLADAESAQVDVQVLVDAHYLDPMYPWDTDEYLVGRGFELVRDHRTLTAASRLTADLIGIKMTDGLMHMKMRLFETPTAKWLLSGSQNPSTEGQRNEEALHLIRDPDLIATYSQAYESVLGSRVIPNTWRDSSAMNVLFSPEASGPRAAKKILEWLESENEQILLMVFSLRTFSAPGVGRDLTAVLRAKAAAGVPVWVITDQKQSDGIDASGTRIDPDDTTEDVLRAAGVHVYEVMNTAGPYNAMHHKTVILGRKRLRIITDTANYSKAALGSSTVPPANLESVLFVDSSALDSGATGRRYLAQWMRVLSRWADQSAIAGEPSYSVAAEQLTALADWPTLTAAFVAHEARTAFGEEVSVLGDLDVLGRWGSSRGGVMLGTDPATYPTWHSLGSMSLAVGQWFDWKLAVRWGTAPPHRWESGTNRSSLAIEPVFSRGSSIVYQATWR